jgi:hypothetical protein
MLIDTVRCVTARVQSCGVSRVRKIGDRWTVTHEHVSVPFEMEPPYKASLDLRP